MLGNNVTGFYPLPVTKTLDPLSLLGLNGNGYLLRRCYHVLRIEEESKCRNEQNEKKQKYLTGLNGYLTPSPLSDKPYSPKGYKDFLTG
ncbi:hypothetical protein EWX74_06170 [Enterococcus faecium]|nr:hypothetical protein [Enterococcus faecium]